MKITDILGNGRVSVSVEVFPPKKETDLLDYHNVVRDVAKFGPAFMSVTYGASGGTSDYTVDIADQIQNVNGITALAHLTCASSDREKVRSVLAQLKEKGIENILALRGDIPEGTVVSEKNYKHASELVREIKSFGDFCIGGACYPDGHPESETLTAEIESLKYKIDAGCEFLTSQMFFDNQVFYSYLMKLNRAGVNVPIIAGIMPVTNAKQIKRICSLSGTALPQRFRVLVDRFGDKPEAMKQAGIAYATDQIIDLIANGVDHIHVYSMNKPDIAGSIIKNLSEIIG